MAIIWQKKVGGDRYEVRAAGRTRRLYTNGVCHSEYNPARIVTGSIWDLLLLPVFFNPPRKVRRVLVLGVGGGAVIRQLLSLLDHVQVTGVDLDPVHLYIARRFYRLQDDRLDLHQADAVDWVAQYRGEPYDVIIEDLFSGCRGEPVRAVAADEAWCRALLDILALHGILVMNFISGQELRQAATISSAAVRRAFSTRFRLTTPALDNVVGAFLRRESDSAALRKRLMGIPVLEKAIRNRRLAYRIKRLD